MCQHAQFSDRTLDLQKVRTDPAFAKESDLKLEMMIWTEEWTMGGDEGGTDFFEQELNETSAAF